MSSSSGALWCGIDCSTQSLKAMLVDSERVIRHEVAVNFDASLAAHFPGMKQGITRQTYGLPGDVEQDVIQKVDAPQHSTAQHSTSRSGCWARCLAVCSCAQQPLLLTHCSSIRRSCCVCVRARVCVCVSVQSGAGSLLVTSPSLQFMYALDEAFAGLKAQNAPLQQVTTAKQMQRAHTQARCGATHTRLS